MAAMTPMTIDSCAGCGLAVPGGTAGCQSIIETVTGSRSGPKPAELPVLTNPQPVRVLWTANVGPEAIHGDWTRTADASAAGGFALQNPDRGRAKVAPAMAVPANYFEIAFTAPAAVRYHLWIRMRAQNNSLSNDSVHLQFSDDSQDATGAPYARIGTSSSAEVVLQDGPSPPGPPHGWGWTDNGWETNGPAIYFASSGPKTLRIQQREDGVYIDQIVLSPDAWLNVAPGQTRDDTVIQPEQQP